MSSRSFRRVWCAAQLSCAAGVLSVSVVGPGCAAGARWQSRAPAGGAVHREGALYIALPGEERTIGVSGREGVALRGRSLWHVDPDGGATRGRTVTRRPNRQALAVPSWLGGGTALFSDAGVLIVDDPPAEGAHAIVRLDAALSNPIVGPRELWARAHGGANGGDWVRIDVTSRTASYATPPIDAPIVQKPLAPWGVADDRSIGGGPEAISPKVAFSVLEILGPAMTRDSGETWSPLAHDVVSEAFPGAQMPNRLVRIGGRLGLATDARIAIVSPTGALGPALTTKSHDRLIDALSLRMEESLAEGVPLDAPSVLSDEGRALVTDGRRLAIATFLAGAPGATTVTLRALRVSRADDMTACRVSSKGRRAPAGGLAMAACVRHDDATESTGAHLVVGPVVDSTAGLRVEVERAFPPGSGARLSSTGAAVVAATCAGSGEAGLDLHAATRLCVRDAAGTWRDVVAVGAEGRQIVVPTDAGAVLVVRDVPGVGTEVVRLTGTGVGSGAPPTVERTRTSHGAYGGAAPAGATAASPMALSLDEAPPPTPREVLDADEVEPGVVVVWRRVLGSLQAIVLDVGGERARISTRGQLLPLREGTLVGVAGRRALVVSPDPAASIPSIPSSTGARPSISPVVSAPPAAWSIRTSIDTGAHWSSAPWPTNAPVLDPRRSSGRLRCGPLGCLVHGWARIGWSAATAAVDSLATLDQAPILAPSPAPPPTTRSLTATCATATPATAVDASRVPQVPFAQQHPTPSDILLGQPPPSVPSAQPLQLIPFIRGAVRGGVIAWGPPTGSWAGASRMIVRFTSDLDSLGSVHETTPGGAPFVDRTAAQRAARALSAFALAPGRVLFSLCDEKCEVYRAVAGAPLEHLDILGDAPADGVSGAAVLRRGTASEVHLANARELGGTLLVTGMLVVRDEDAAGRRTGAELVGFASLLGPSGTTSWQLARGAPAEGTIAATADPARGRFGLLTHSRQPTWTGGTTYVLPIDSFGRASGGFERIAGGPSEWSRPSEPCASSRSHAPGWDRAEQNTLRELTVSIDGGRSVSIAGDGGGLRARLASHGACLDRLTVIGARASFQLDAASRHAVLLELDDDAKGARGAKHAIGATRTELACSVRWGGP